MEDAAFCRKCGLPRPLKVTESPRKSAKSPPLPLKQSDSSPTSPSSGKGAGSKKGGPPFGKGKAPAAKAPPKGPQLEPRKPEVKPAVQVKKLYWSSFRVENSSARTVWNEIEAEDTHIDTTELEALFADEPMRSNVRNARSPSPSLADLAPKRQAVKKVQVLDSQRRRQICVMLARLPEKEDISEAVFALDTELLDKDQVELILLNTPSQEEIQLMHKTAADHEFNEFNVWDTAEEFLYTLIGIPQFQLRLQVWDFENSFQERLQTVSKAASIISQGCELVHSSAAIKHLLGLVLFVGNYLNGGTPRGRADGFAIDTLTQIRTVKMSQGERAGTLVDYITQQMERAHPRELEEFLGSGGETESIKNAARYKLGELVEEVQQFRATADQMLRMLESPGNGADATIAQHGKIMAANVAELEGLRMRLVHLDERYHELGAWFHMEDEKNRKPTDEFFGIWDKFLNDIRQARERLQANEKKEAQTAQRRLTPRRASIQVTRLQQTRTESPFQRSHSMTTPRRKTVHSISSRDLPRPPRAASPPMQSRVNWSGQDATRGESPKDSGIQRVPSAKFGTSDSTEAMDFPPRHASAPLTLASWPSAMSHARTDGGGALAGFGVSAMLKVSEAPRFGSSSSDAPICEATSSGLSGPQVEGYHVAASSSPGVELTQAAGSGTPSFELVCVGVGGPDEAGLNDLDATMSVADFGDDEEVKSPV